MGRFENAATEAANRAEATALLIRCGYRVYRPEADIEGEDLVVRAPSKPGEAAGDLRAVQLKGRALVDWHRYGARQLWMLFPSAQFDPQKRREWFLVEHDRLYQWVATRHGHTPDWDTRRYWSYPSISEDLRKFLAGCEVAPPPSDAAEE